MTLPLPLRPSATYGQGVTSDSNPLPWGKTAGLSSLSFVLFVVTAGFAALVGTLLSFGATIEQSSTGGAFASGVRGVAVVALVATIGYIMTPRFLRSRAPIWALGIASALAYIVTFVLTTGNVAFSDLIASHPAAKFFMDAIVWFMGTSLGIWWGQGAADEQVSESLVVNQPPIRH